MASHRRQSRILAMQTLCQWEVQRDESSAALEQFLASSDVPDRARPYARELVTIFWQHAEFVDKQIGDAAERWSFDRISSVERNIMRVAVTELTCLEVPPKVVLDEAIEIAREYGGQESPRFVNGVLDRILQMLPEREKGED